MGILIDRPNFAVFVDSRTLVLSEGFSMSRTSDRITIGGDWEELAAAKGAVETLSRNPVAYGPYNYILDMLGRVPAGEPVDDGMPISVIGIKNLDERHFSLRPQDRRPLPRVSAAGKSAFIACTTDVRPAVAVIMASTPRRGDRLFVAPAWAIREAGFDPIHAPTERHPLHVRLVPNPEVYDHTGDIPRAARERLAATMGEYLMPLPQRQVKATR